MFDNCYRGKKVLVTGHTGFKGTWLTAWLLSLGADVVGLSIDVRTKPAMFEVLGLESRIRHRIADVRDTGGVKKIVEEEQPDFVFHLAAQAIVSRSYSDPIDTFTTNILGTMNVLEALRSLKRKCVAVLITSDKCYDNVEWVWGYRETDALGGKDIYSGSKGAAELVIKSYLHSFFSSDVSLVRIGVARAGNVIGGGDWSEDRIIADCVRAWSVSRPVMIRSPQATRPWQHVLEPLSGYLTLGQSLAAASRLHGEAFNFGPRNDQNRTVLDLLRDLALRWGIESAGDAYEIANVVPFDEAKLLKLNCDKALFHLKWLPTLTYEEMIGLVGDWYGGFYRASGDMLDLTGRQIAEYERLAAARGLGWAAGS